MWQKINKTAHDTYLSSTIITTILVFSLASWSHCVFGLEPEEVPITAPLLDRNHAEQAYHLVLDWIRNSKVPKSVERPIPVTGLFGVRVTLRLDGMTAGKADAYSEQCDPDEQLMVDMAELLRQASQQSLEQVRSALTNARLKAISDGWVAQIDRTTELEDIAHRLLLDIQLGYDLETVRIPETEADFELSDIIIHGWHGLRIIGKGVGQGSCSWPATALAGNIPTRNQLIQLLLAEGCDLHDLDQLGRPGGPTLQLFKVLHYVKPLLDLQAQQLVRGNDILPPQSMDQWKLAILAERLMNHLQRRFLSNGQVRGRYHPTSNRYDPPQASDEDTALAAYAIIRQCDLLLSQGRNHDYIIDNTQRAMDVIIHLSEQQLQDPNHIQPAVCALALLSFIDYPLVDRNRELRDRIGELLRDLFDPVAGFRTSTAVNSPYTNEATSSVIILSLAALYDQTLNEQLGQSLTEMMLWFWKYSKGNPNISSLPWYTMAHVRGGRTLLKNLDEETTSQFAIQQRSLAELLDTVCGYQIIEEPPTGPNDVLGGFKLNFDNQSKSPDPDWRSAQMLTFLAMALRHENILEHGDQFGWLLSASLTARFIDQLSMHQANCYYVRSLDDTLGGVRFSLIDNRLAITPTAISLLAVTELQLSLIHLDRQ